MQFGERPKDLHKELKFAKEELLVREVESERKPESEALAQDVETARRRVEKLQSELGISPDHPEGMAT